MRILQVRLKNLNSLCGEWTIDFTHPAYTSDGIFAITGPTGAGKTTILDAVCLGLYGRTPRLNKVTRGANEIMSRQTGECFAEVTFETAIGRYKCHWSQHRARRKSDGELQNPKHEISDMDTGKVFETKLRDVAEYIETVTGMDFDRFTRSMLLAQGGFAAFLQAGPDERAPILEQITGTEVYSQISIKVHERWAEERGKLELLKAELAGMRFLTEEEEQHLCAVLEEKLKRENELAGTAEQLNKAVAWLDGIAALERDLAAVEEQWRAFELKRESFQPDRKRLDNANKALPLGGDFAGLRALRDRQRTETLEVSEAGERVPVLEAALAAARDVVRDATGKLEEKRAEQKQEAEVIRKVRELDLKITEIRARVESSEESLKLAGQEMVDKRNGALATEKALEKSRADLMRFDDYIGGHSADAGLVANLAAIVKTFESLRETRKQYKMSRNALSVTERQKDAATKTLAELEAAAGRLRSGVAEAERVQAQLAEAIQGNLDGREFSDWRKELETLKERKLLLEQTLGLLANISALRRSLEELLPRRTALVLEREKVIGEIEAETGKHSVCELEIGHLETQVNLLSRIRSLEEERGRLEDDKPCPLCGATDHPYARGNIPEMSNAEAALKRARKELKKISANLSALKVRQAKVEKDIEQAGREQEELNRSLEADRKRCLEALAVLRIDAGTDDPSVEAREERDSAKSGIDRAAGVIQEVEQLEKKRSVALKALEKARSASVQADRDLQEATHRKETVERDLERIGGEFRDLADRLSKADAEAMRELEPYGVRELSPESMNDLQKDLTARRDRWQDTMNKKSALERQISYLGAELEKQQLLIERMDEDLRAKRAADDDLRRRLGVLVGERVGLYGSKKADEEEKRFAEAVENAEKALELARAAWNRADREVGDLKTRIATLHASIADRVEEIRRAGHAFDARLAQAGFADEVAYETACLPEDERIELNLKAEFLVKEQTELDTRRRDKTGLLAEEREKMVSTRDREQLGEELEGCGSSLKETQREIGAVTQRLAEDRTLRSRQKERIEAIEAQKIEYERWDALHDLIGSADGKKYRNFAQGLTFEIMVAHANRQLRKMTDRYLLMRDDAQPLELNVIDSYQAGEIRSTKNLSGGESFIVSLSLALGLSRIASRNVRVDSLFLDEGFGTLDEDALETALETLAGLRQDGKIIGVISHVPALRERIATQIQVIPQTGGRGMIKGPGCGNNAAAAMPVPGRLSMKQ